MSDVHERLFNLSGDLMIACGPDGRVLEVNAACERLLGWTREELIGKPIVDLAHPDHREQGAAGALEGESRLRGKDGEFRWFEWTVALSSAPDEPILAVGRDVTGLRRETDALHSFQSLFTGLGDFAALVGLDGEVLHLNEAGRRLVGRGTGEGIDLSFEQVAGVAEAALLVGERIPAAVARGSWEGEGELRRVDGARIAVSQVIAPVYDAGGRAIAAALVARDHAEAARFEEELQRRFSQQEALAAATSTPIIQVWDDIVTMPVVGLVDSVRAADMKTSLLEVVARTGARFAIVDLTGVDTVDTATADHLLKVMRAVHLLGARCVITGIQPAVAQIIVSLGLELQGVITLRSLREGLRFCLRRLGFKIQREVKQPVSAAAPGSA